jgi:short-subunit dehydrogenase
MTASMGTKKMADPKDVAETLALAIEKGKSVAYAPSIWKYIMFIIKNIPKTLWHKTNF